MKIVSEIGWGHKPGGAIRVAVNAIRHMAELRADNEYFVFSNSLQVGLEHPSITQCRFAAPSFVPKVVWDQFIFPHAVVPGNARRLKADVTLYSNNIMSYWHRGPCVVVIHDMTPFLLPESFYWAHAVYQRSYFRFAARHADRIITVSENSKADICRILGVAESKVVVTPLAANLPQITSSQELPEKFGIEKPYILYVGAIHPRKNVGRLIAAFADLKASKKIPHQLIIAGQLRWMSTEKADRERLTKLGNQIRFIGSVTDNELVSLYQNADVFVYPSLYEGFGLPVLEAMSLGVPVVTSNVSSLPEVAGDAARLVDPHSTVEIMEGIWEIIDQPSYAAELRDKGVAQASQFSWKQHANKVLEVLESVA